MCCSWQIWWEDYFSDSRRSSAYWWWLELITDENHHLTPCPLHPLRVGFIPQFGFVYMHMACLGVMCRLTLYWKGPVGPLSVRLPRNSVLQISKHLAVFAAHSPSEWALLMKATEFRQLRCTADHLFCRECCLTIYINAFCCCLSAWEFCLASSCQQCTVTMQMSYWWSLW